MQDFYLQELHWVRRAWKLQTITMKGRNPALLKIEIFFHSVRESYLLASEGIKQVTTLNYDKNCLLPGTF